MHGKNIFGILIAISAVFLEGLSGCSKFDCPIGKGSTDSVTRLLPAFNQISLVDKIDLVITYDSLQSVKIAGSGNTLKGIQTTVKDSILYISNGNQCSLLADPAQSVTVYVSSSLLNKITYAGAGNISSVNSIQANSFTVECMQGSGSINLILNTQQANAIIRAENADITFHGQSNSTFTYTVDAGSIDLSDFPSSYITAYNKSVRNMYVNVSNNGTLNANILYIGNLYYKGNPTVIDSVVSNSGRLIHQQ